MVVYIDVMFIAYLFHVFLYRKSKHGYGAITSDGISTPSESTSAETTSESTTSAPHRRPGKKPSMVYCVHGTLNGEDCCDNGGTTTVNIKQMDSELSFLYFLMFFLTKINLNCDPLWTWEFLCHVFGETIVKKREEIIEDQKNKIFAVICLTFHFRAALRTKRSWKKCLLSLTTFFFHCIIFFFLRTDATRHSLKNIYISSFMS